MHKRSVSAIWIVGLVFTLLGGLFLILGAALLYGLRHTEAWITGVVFLAVGGVFFPVGLILLAEDAKQRRRLKRLVESGRYVWGQVVALEPNTRIRINDRHPYYAVIRCTDLYGRETRYESRSSMALRHRNDLVGRQVKVYVGDDPAKDYAVDLDSLLR